MTDLQKLHGGVLIKRLMNEHDVTLSDVVATQRKRARIGAIALIFKGGLDHFLDEKSIEDEEQSTPKSESVVVSRTPEENLNWLQGTIP